MYINPCRVTWIKRTAVRPVVHSNQPIDRSCRAILVTVHYNKVLTAKCKCVCVFSIFPVGNFTCCHILCSCEKLKRLAKHKITVASCQLPAAPLLALALSCGQQTNWRHANITSRTTHAFVRACLRKVCVSVYVCLCVCCVNLHWLQL